MENMEQILHLLIFFQNCWKFQFNENHNFASEYLFFNTTWGVESCVEENTTKNANQKNSKKLYLISLEKIANAKEVLRKKTCCFIQCILLHCNGVNYLEDELLWLYIDNYKEEWRLYKIFVFIVSLSSSSSSLQITTFFKHTKFCNSFIPITSCNPFYSFRLCLLITAVKYHSYEDACYTNNVNSPVILRLLYVLQHEAKCNCVQYCTIKRNVMCLG